MGCEKQLQLELQRRPFFGEDSARAPQLATGSDSDPWKEAVERRLQKRGSLACLLAFRSIAQMENMSLDHLSSENTKISHFKTPGKQVRLQS